MEYTESGVLGVCWRLRPEILTRPIYTLELEYAF